MEGAVNKPLGLKKPVKFLQLHMNYASLGAYTSLETMETMCIWYELEISTPTKFTKLVPSI
jgi:hypothetical protein